MGEVRSSILFDEETHRRALALARANFPTPTRGGNINAVIRLLINQAYTNPDKFGLVPAVDEPGASKAGSR